MDDLNNYSLDAIYEMIQDGTISVEDLAEYITEVAAEMPPTEELREFLIAASEYMDRRIESGYEVSEPSPKEETIQEVIEEAEAVPKPEQVVEQPEPVVTPTPVFVSPVIEEPEPVLEVEQEEKTNDNVEVPELAATEYPFFESDGNSYEEARQAMDEVYLYCQTAGMSVEDISLSGKGGRGPHISFEINHESKQFLDHLMNEFYQDNDGISLEFMRDMTNKQEIFTININPENMSREQFFNHVKETFQRIYGVIETTRKDFDYESAMPDGLKQIKDRFANDDPDINQDFTIGYINKDGKDTYYLVADNDAAAIEYARSIGYEIKSKPGANIHEIDATNTIGTKLDDAAIALEDEKDVYDIKTNGVADLDIYGSLEQDPRVEMIENFIETSNDPHLMCILEVEVPVDNPSQRIVKMKTEMGGSDVVVFTDGHEFDNKVLPKVIDTYAQNNPIEQQNISVSSPDPLDRASCQVESENNTTFMASGYSSNEVNKMVSDIESKSQTYASEQTNEKTNARQKTIGTYPNSNTTQDNAFVSMPVLFVICILFVLMLALIIFAG
ncbi:MAG: hypothetical protein IJN90_03995 [Bacilli bacterium]|nr:hypothetical protein [Bacilli bacterium]